MFNYLLGCKNNVDYIICPPSVEKLTKTKQIFIKPKVGIYSKLKTRYFNFDKNEIYLIELERILKVEKTLIIQIIDNVGLLNSVQGFIKKNKIKLYNFHIPSE
jgi:hypothetical protein